MNQLHTTGETVREVAHRDDARDEARNLIDQLVRTAAPRLGKTAVARIAGPLTEGIVAHRDEIALVPDLPTVEQVAEVYRRQHGYGDDAVEHCVEQAGRMLKAVREAQRLNGAAPVERDEVITDEVRLALVPLTALIRDADSITFEKAGPLDSDPDVWAMPGGEGRFRPSLPVRVLDLGIPGERA